MAAFAMAGCLWTQLPSAGTDAPATHVIRASQYAFTADFPIAKSDEAVADLIRLRGHLAETLALPPARRLIRVTLFDSQQSFEEHFRRSFPELPHRRAFFLKQGDDLLVFACKGEHLRADLRHEATHALLNATLPNVPIWLDEGLAEYFENWSEPGAVKSEHVRRLLSIDRKQLAAQCNLPGLEGKRDLWQMSAADYRASWLWSHFCLHGPPAAKDALLAHLAALKENRADSLANRLAQVVPDPNARLVEHLLKIEAAAVLTMADNPTSNSPKLR